MYLWPNTETYLDLIILDPNGHTILLLLIVHTCIMEYYYYYQGMLYLF